MKSTMDFDEVTVFGARGHSELLLRGIHIYWQGRVKVRALIDDTKNGFEHPVLGVPVISSNQRREDYADVPVMLTPADCALRRSVFDALVDEGAILATVAGPEQAYVDPQVTYGAGSFVAPLTRIGPRVNFGEGVQVLSSLIAHDVEVGAFTTLNTQTTVLGHVIIGRGVTIAPHAVIGNGTRDKPLRIGDGAVIGVGAVVARDVEAGARMVGNPAMTVERWKSFSRWLDGQTA